MELSAIIDALRDPAAYPEAAGPGPVEVVQTHASVVFLVGQYAYKIKKPVDFGFLDYSTLERRRVLCKAEVELNRRLAPNTYLGVVDIVEDENGVKVEGRGKAVEYAVKMRRLPDDARLGALLTRDELDEVWLDRVAMRVARFHRDARRGPDVSALAGYDSVRRNCEENFEQLEPMIGEAISQSVYDRLAAATRRELQHRRSLIEDRARAGVACETHGDLRLEHVYVFPDRAPPDDIAIVDCIEFNERFRFADPIADVAFLVMDMRAHAHREAARRLQDAYVEHSGDHEGAALFDLYCAYRATVRGKVRAMQASESEIPQPDRQRALQVARGHLLQALGEIAAPQDRPCLLLMCGLPGTGKSVLAHALAHAAGFTVIRSDVTRKELAGMPHQASATTTPEGGIYAQDWTQRTYDECEARAEPLLFEGARVIVDATFRNEAQRLQFVELARRFMVPVRILHCVAPEGIVHRRLDERQGDPSDADWGVYQHMRTIWEPFGDTTAPLVDQVRSAGEPHEICARALDALRAQGLVSSASTDEGEQSQ